MDIGNSKNYLGITVQNNALVSVALGTKVSALDRKHARHLPHMHMVS